MPQAYEAVTLFAIIAGALALAGFAAAGILDGIDTVRDRLDRRRHRAAVEHAAAMDAFRRAAQPEPDALTQAYREHIDHAIGRHALDALDGLEADGLDPETDGLALARAIAAAVGRPLE